MTKIVFRRSGDIVRLPFHGAKVGKVVGTIVRAGSHCWYFNLNGHFTRFYSHRDAKLAAIKAMTGEKVAQT